MAYKQEIQEQADHIIITCTGQIEDPEDLKVLSKGHYAEITRRNFKKVLVDMRELRLPQGFMKHLDLIDFSLSEKNFPDVKKFRIAVVFKEDYKETGHFWETFSVNRGFFFRVFFAMEEAIAWIRSS